MVLCHLLSDVSPVIGLIMLSRLFRRIALEEIVSLMVITLDYAAVNMVNRCMTSVLIASKLHGSGLLLFKAHDSTLPDWTGHGRRDGTKLCDDDQRYVSPCLVLCHRCVRRCGLMLILSELDTINLIQQTFILSCVFTMSLLDYIDSDFINDSLRSMYMKAYTVVMYFIDIFFFYYFSLYCILVYNDFVGRKMQDRKMRD